MFSSEDSSRNSPLEINKTENQCFLKGKFLYMEPSFYHSFISYVGKCGNDAVSNVPDVWLFS